ncbi:MAG: hypothetical protein ACLFSY_04840 [Desulfonatronovibrionaceae bacterium]
MAKRRIELVPVKKQVTFNASEWLVIVMYTRYQDLEKLQEKLRLDDSSLNAILESLEKKQVLKVTGESGEPQSGVPSAFWAQMEKELSRYIGPIATAVIDDELGAVNKTRESITKDGLYSLVEKVATEIDSQSNRVNFQNTMLEMIKSM